MYNVSRCITYQGVSFFMMKSFSISFNFLPIVVLPARFFVIFLKFLLFFSRILLNVLFLFSLISFDFHTFFCLFIIFYYFPFCHLPSTKFSQPCVSIVGICSLFYIELVLFFFCNMSISQKTLIKCTTVKIF